MADGPVQLVLNSNQFQQVPRARGGGQLRDFYKGRDEAFVEHRESMCADLDGIIDGVEPEMLLHVRVMMRTDALAKSHRPFDLLFRPSRATHVGTNRFGELIFAISAAGLSDVRTLIATAEEVVEYKTDAAGESKYSPSPARAEASAIASIDLWSSERARTFTLEDGRDWLAESVTPTLRVSTFALPRLPWLRPAAIEAHRSLRSTMATFGTSVRFASELDASPASGASGLPSIGESQSGTARAAGRIEENTNAQSLIRERFLDALAQLETNTVVRRVDLDEEPEETEEDDWEGGPVLPEAPAKPQLEGNGDARLPVVGVIDGGVAGEYTTKHVVGAAGIIAPADRDVHGAKHGTEIASVIAQGHLYNAHFLSETERCDVYDLDLITPRRTWALYYASTDDFFATLQDEVRRAKETLGVRVFNMSYSLRQPPGRRSYSIAARHLDRIALQEDVIFVLPISNLATSEIRDAWPASKHDHAAYLPADTSPTGVPAPADSITNLTVAAVNPPELVYEFPYAPTRYTRRGAPVPSTIKPDIAAIGGAYPTAEGTGLVAMNPWGNLGEVHGTSYAAPIAARTLAALDQAIVGGVSRETLIGLMVHFAARPPRVFDSREASAAAQRYVGHGVHSSAGEMLDGAASALSFVISDTIRPRQRIEFPVTWPAALTNAHGASAGKITLTLVYRPVIDTRHGDEQVRVNLEAAFQQASPDGRFKKHTDATHSFFTGVERPAEHERITEYGKWHPLKTYERLIPNGVGGSPDWRVTVEAQARAGESIPEEGVPFALIITIADQHGEGAVFNEMRADLTAIGAQLSDLRTAVRVSVR